MKNTNLISLVGYRGCGKSTIGLILSKMLKYKFCDIDEYIKKKEGLSITEIFKSKGEVAFRAIESQSINEVFNTYDKTIIATGGGSILSPENRETIKKCSFVIYLECNVKESVIRISSGVDRPRLDNEHNLTDEVMNAIEYRKPFYNEVSDMKVNASYGDFKDKAKDIINRINILEKE